MWKTSGTGELFAANHIFLILLLIVPVLGIHFLPAIIAGVRHTRNFNWILLVNIFLAWTLIGWVIALIWALRDEPRYVLAPAMPPPYNP